MSELAIPTAMNALERVLRTDADAQALLQPLRALQRLGLSKGELNVLVERIRAVNDALEQDETIEDNSLLVLEIISGDLTTVFLRWDSAEMARITLPRVVTAIDIGLGLVYAFEPSNLLPPRAQRALPGRVEKQLTSGLQLDLDNYEYEPQPADFYRVPKDGGGGATRPAALLSPSDRLIYEALANLLIDLISSNLPSQVVWPRSREIPNYAIYSEAPAAWESSHVVVADIDSFYESIDHNLLAAVFAGSLGATSDYCQAVEGVLGSIMGLRIGLPQGPPASDIFATSFLIPIDRKLNELGWNWSRYADDYAIAAESVIDGRRKLEALETFLREFGLRLNASKSRVLLRSTFTDSRDEVPKRVLALREKLHDMALASLGENEDEEEVLRELEAAGVEDQILWDVFYHKTLALDDVIDIIREKLRPSLVDSYLSYLRQILQRLDENRILDDMRGAERDIRACLIYLASADHGLSVGDLDLLLRWFPRLAPVVASYLKAVSTNHSDTVVSFLEKWLSPPLDSDWITAWLCNVTEIRSELVRESIAILLRSLARDESVGELTKSAAVRALAANGKLDSATWDYVLQRTTRAIRAELLLGRFAEPKIYPGDSAPLEGGLM